MLAIDCGIDIGSTNIKVVFVGEGGEVLWTLSHASPRTNDGIGPVTNPLTLLETLEGMLIRGWRELRLGAAIRSITTTGVGEDGCGVDASLHPIGPAIPWFDKRAHHEAQTLGEFSAFHSRTGIAMDETRTAAKWLWLSTNRPDELAADATWLTLTDFPTAWWAGQAFMSSSLAPRTACYDVRARNWIPELLVATRAPRLPEVLEAGTIIGGVRPGLLRECGVASSETALVVGGHDHPIAASLIRRMDSNARVDSLGTANLIYGETQTFDDSDLTDQLAFSIPPSGEGYACLGVIAFSATLQKLSGADKIRSFLSLTRLPGGPPNSAAQLDVAAVEADTQLRRTLEGLSFSARKKLSALDQAGVPEGKIYTTGGWSRSKSFVELRASVIGQPIVALGDLEMTALGAALYGTQASGGEVCVPPALKAAGIVNPVPEWSAAYQLIADLID